MSDNLTTIPEPKLHPDREKFAKVGMEPREVWLPPESWEKGPGRNLEDCSQSFYRHLKAEHVQAERERQRQDNRKDRIAMRLAAARDKLLERLERTNKRLDELKYGDERTSMDPVPEVETSFVVPDPELAEDEKSQAILGALREKPMRQGELFDLFSRNLDAATLDKLLAELESSGVITSRVESTGGRPATVWSLATPSSERVSE